MVATVDEVADFWSTSLQKSKPIFRKWLDIKNIKLSGDADEHFEAALNSNLLKPIKPEKKKKHK